MAPEAAAQLSPGQAKLWAGVARAATGEGGGNGGTREGGVLTPVQAQEQLREIQANPAYFDRRHADHARLVQRAAKLAELAYQGD
jgi:hypothetical protein